MPTNPFKPRDSELQAVWGTIIEPRPEEFAFVCRVKLDDGREVEAMIARRDFAPERPPAINDRVYLTVHDGLCLVSQWQAQI